MKKTYLIALALASSLIAAGCANKAPVPWARARADRDKLVIPLENLDTSTIKLGRIPVKKIKELKN